MNTHKHTIKPEEKKKIQAEISAFISDKSPKVVFAYLFGSFLNKESFSDIDIGVFADSAIENPLEFEIDLETRIEDIAKYSADVRVLNQAPLSFCQNVIKSGRVIVDHDSNIRADFEGLILKKYFDYRKIEKQYLTEVLHAPI